MTKRHQNRNTVHYSCYCLPLNRSDGQYFRSYGQISSSQVSGILFQKLKLIWAHSGFKFIASARVQATQGPASSNSQDCVQCTTIAAECVQKSRVLREHAINPLALELDICSLAHHLCKMWIFYEPRRITLGNTRHFMEE